jgi:hypothetical protein
MAAYCRVRMWRGGLRLNLLLPPLSFGGAPTITPFPHPPYRTGQVDLRLSDKTHNLRTRKVIRSSLDPQHKACHFWETNKTIMVCAVCNFLTTPELAKKHAAF